MPIAPEFRITHNVDEVKRRLSNIAASQAPFATALGLTRIAQDIQAENRRVMHRVFDRPTPFTLNAFAVIPAKKRTPVAFVIFRPFGQTSSGAGAEAYLGPQEFGGPRRAKRFEKRLRGKGVLGANEFAVPARGARLDRFGNIPGPRIVQILSQLKAFNTAGFNANQTEKGRKKAIKQGKAQFFAVKSGDKTTLPAGVYERTGAKKRGLKAVLIFVKQPFYRPRLGFFDTARRVYAERIDRQMSLAFREAIRTAR